MEVVVCNSGRKGNSQQRRGGLMAEERVIGHHAQIRETARDDIARRSRRVHAVKRMLEVACTQP